MVGYLDIYTFYYVSLKQKYIFQIFLDEERTWPLANHFIFGKKFHLSNNQQQKIVIQLDIRYLVITGYQDPVLCVAG